MSFLSENKVKMFKRKIISKYNFIRQEIENTNQIFERAKSEIDEKVGMFLKSDHDTLATNFSEIDRDLEAFHNKLCFIQDELENGKLNIENDGACSLNGRNKEASPDTQSGASGSSQTCVAVEQVESVLSLSSQNGQISCRKNNFSEQLTSQHHSTSEKKMNTKSSVCAAEPGVSPAFRNDTFPCNMSLTSNISAVQNNIKTNTVHDIKETNIERSKFCESDKSSFTLEHVSSSDGSSVYDTVSSVCSEVPTVDKSEIVPSKDFGKQVHGAAGCSFQENIDDCHSVESPVNCKWNNNEDAMRTSSATQSSDVSIPYPDLQIGSQITGTVQGATSPSDFWIQIDCVYVKDLCPITNAECCEQLLAVKKGMYCLAPLKQSGDYFRAKIMELSEKVSGKPRAKLLYIDLGCKKSLVTSTLKVLPASLQQIPSAAVHCALHGVVPVDGVWTNKAVEEFRRTIEVSNIKIFLCSRVNDTYFVEISMTAGIPGNKTFTYDMVDMLCEFNYALRTDNIANIYRQVIPSSESSATVSSSSTVNLPIPSAPSNSVSNMNSGDNLMLTKTGSPPTNIPCDRSALKCNFQPEVLHSKESQRRPAVASKEGDRRTVIGRFVAQNAHLNVKNVANHQKGAIASLCCDAVTETNSDLSNRMQPRESKHCVNSSAISSTDPQNDISLSVTNGSTNAHTLLQSSSDDFDWDVSIPFPSQKFEKKAKYVVMLSAYVSPSDFYVNLAMPNSTELDELQEQMLSAYQNFDTSNMILPSADKLCGMFCCCQFADDKNWYRVQVLGCSNSEENVQNSTVRVLVQYVDYGNEAEVNVRDLIPLKKEFAKHPAFAFHCSLSGIKPKLSDNSCVNGENNQWSTEAVSRFRKLINFDKCYTAEIADAVMYEKRKAPLPIYLWDTVSAKDILINAILVEQGAADGSDLELLYSAAEENTEVIDKWDPMSADYNSMLNSYGVNLNDPEVATVGYKATDEAYVCKFFAATGNCYRGDKCYYQHIFSYGDSTVDKVPVEYLGENIELPAVNSTVFVLLSALFSPGHFFVVFPFGTKSIELLQSEIRRCTHKEDDVISAFMDSMNRYYNRDLHRKENTALVPACGDLIAVKWKKDGRWYRGRVSDILDTTTPVLTSFLDYGNCEAIERENVRELEPQFRHFPFQAVECLLYGIEPKSSGEGQIWSKESTEKFLEITEGQVLAARIKRTYNSSLYVELFICCEDEEFSISEYLIHNGYGQPVQQQISCNNSVSSHSSWGKKGNRNVVFIAA